MFHDDLSVCSEEDPWADELNFAVEEKKGSEALPPTSPSDFNGAASSVSVEAGGRVVPAGSLRKPGGGSVAGCVPRPCGPDG
eukprot:2928631-Pyramimonas_sp.AAC.1